MKQKSLKLMLKTVPFGPLKARLGLKCGDDLSVNHPVDLLVSQRLSHLG